MKTVHKKLMSVLVVVFVLLLLFSAVMSGRVSLPAFAAEREYTGALEDLQKASDFDASAYPDKADDYSIQVIQVAESTDGELFIYTYQPCQNTTYLMATEINMSLTAKIGGEVAEDEEMSPADRSQLYGLTFLTGNGVFCKYKVNDFIVNTNTVRYYNIVSIYRAWLKGIDAETGNDNTKNAVAFPVGKLYTAITKDGEVIYICENRKLVKILNPWAGFLRYTDGFFLKTTACDSHFLAFSTDWNIDDLYEADVTYQERSVHYYHKWMVGGQTDYGEWENKYAFLTDEQEFEKDRTGWLFGSEAKYNRIQSVEKFIASEDLTDTTKESLKGKQWVLRFAETDCTFIYDGSDQGNNYWSEVSNVTILRLKFKSAGVVYNLGAVSDKITEDRIPDNVQPEFNFWQYVWNCVVKLFQGKANFVETIVAIVAILVVLVLLPLGVFILSIIFPAFGAVVKAIFKGLWTLLVWLAKGLWWLICLPFKGIAALVRKIKKE